MSEKRQRSSAIATLRRAAILQMMGVGVVGFSIPGTVCMPSTIQKRSLIISTNIVTGRRSVEEHFPHHNWLITMCTLPIICYVGHIMFTPSIYQFVTTPRSAPDDDEVQC